jgi:hypothetical protein
MMAAEIAPEAVQLDLIKLAAIAEEPQQQLYVLNFLSTLERLVDRLDADGASAYQLFLQRELLRVVQLTAPAPTRLIRNVAGRCFAGVFAKGDRKLLYDTINELLNVINAGKDKDVRNKHAAVHCLGEVLEVAGDSAIALATFASSSLLKLLKNASNNCGLRSSLFKSMGKIYILVAGKADESTARDIWKAARNAAAGDKSAIVQASALQVDRIFYLFTDFVFVIGLMNMILIVPRIYGPTNAVLFISHRLRETTNMHPKSIRLFLLPCTTCRSIMPGISPCTSIHHRP